MNAESFLKKHLNYKVIKRADSNLYLTRFYIFRKTKWWLPSIYIHCFHSSDWDLELHNHPWKRSLSFILSGTYKEEYRKGDSVKTRVLTKGDFNYITSNRFHRVSLITPNVWTLFISGSKIKDWGFWNRKTKQYVAWQNHKSTPYHAEPAHD